VSLTFLLNGAVVSIDGVPPQTTLLDFVRSRGLTGAKEGCAEGECGACAVAVVAPDGDRSAYRVVNSCLLFVPMLAGHEVHTVEALADHGKLSEVQEAMAAAGGSQCGYCTPGFVMSLFAEQYRRDREGPCHPLSLAGNLCRCTGYRPIADAALSVGPAPAGALLDRLDRPAPSPDAVAIPGFSRPATLAACLAELAAHPDAQIVAGGTDAGVESNLRRRRWPHIVSLDAVDELRQFEAREDVVRIGAGLSLSEIGRQFRLRQASGGEAGGHERGAPDAFAEWLELFASPSIRNRATLGGNLATASPIGDAAPLLLALDAAIEIAGRDGRRRVPLATFFTGYRRTVLQHGELIVAVELPRPLPATVRFYKVSKRRLDDISTVAAAMAIDREADGRVRRARFAFGGVAATPMRATAAEQAVEGQPWDEAAVERVQQAVARAVTPIADARGSREYRLAMATSLVAKFWWDRSAGLSADPSAKTETRR
jgi:xanthine dehydrogenase small subunit